MIKKTILSLILMCSAYGFAHAQWYVGGNMGMHFENSNVYANVSHEVGHKFLDGKLSVGVAPFLAYTKKSGYDPEYSYGGRVITRFDIINGLYVTAQAQAENFDTSEGRKWEYAIPVGVGYYYSMGHVSIYAEVTYDLLFDDDSYGENPIIRGGVNYNF